MNLEQIDSLDERAKPEDYKITTDFPYWVGGSRWTIEAKTKVTFLFRGHMCHGISNHEDGNILWNEEGWCDPDLAWADFVKSYSLETEPGNDQKTQI